VEGNRRPGSAHRPAAAGAPKPCLDLREWWAILDSNQ
jgi:hypothetical protein